jgi:hypothetical protein
MNTELTAVVTTVMEPTPSLRRLTAALGPVRGALVVVGDEKGPPRFKQIALLPGFPSAGGALRAEEHGVPGRDRRGVEVHLRDR